MRCAFATSGVVTNVHLRVALPGAAAALGGISRAMNAKRPSAGFLTLRYALCDNGRNRGRFGKKKRRQTISPAPLLDQLADSSGMSLPDGVDGEIDPASAPLGERR
jgi:hypothetical protein